MPELKDLVTKGSLTVIDGLLLVVASLALTYLSLPLIYKFVLLVVSFLPPEGGDIKIIGILVFLGVGSFLVLMTLLGSIALGFLIFRFMPSRIRLLARLTLAVVLLPILMGSFRSGPRQYFYLLMHPEVRASQEKYKASEELQKRLKFSRVLAIAQEDHGIKIANTTDQIIRVQVAFLYRVNREVHYCYPREYARLSDPEMTLAPQEIRVFLAGECKFEDYAVWGRDLKGVPIFLSANAWLP